MPQEKWTERLVRYQCLEPLIAGRRCLEVGCGTGRAADHLAQVADQVEAIDTSSLVLNQARRHYLRANLQFEIAEPDRLAFPSHAFDVVIVPELQRWIARGGLIPELRRVLAPDGVAVFAVPSADAGYEHGLSYHDFIEYLSQGFNHVRLLGEVPFLGTIMADFEPDEELEPELDCSLVEEDEAPQGYLAVCSDSPVAAVGYTVVQLPGAPESSAAMALQQDLDRARQQARQAEVRAEEWANKVESVSSQLFDRGEELEAVNVRVQQLESELALTRSADVDLDVDLVAEHKDLKEQRDALLQRVEELEQYGAERRAGEASADVEELRRQLAEAERRVLEASTKARSELTRTRRELRDKSDEATRAGEELAAVRVALEEARALLAEQRQRGGQEPEAGELEGLRAELEATRQELQQTVEASRQRIGELEGELGRSRGAVASEAGGSELEALRRLVDSLGRQLESERERADRERQRADDLGVELSRERGARVAAEHREEAERASLLDERRRAESAESRSDSLISRVEQGAQQLSALHERIAELQALRQSERWRSDELLGRLRECQAALGASAEEWSAEPTRRETADVEAASQELSKISEARAAAERRAEQAEARIVELDREVEGLRLRAKEASAAKREQPADRQSSEHLRGDLGRALARIEQLEARCDELLAEAQLAAETAQEARHALKRVETATDVAVEGESPDETATMRVQEEPERVVQIRNLEAELQRARAVATELQATDSELRDARKAIEELRETERELRRRLRQAERPQVVDESEELRRRATLLSEGERERRELSHELGQAQRRIKELETRQPASDGETPWQGDELLSMRERQIDALLEGAALHRGEVERLGQRVEELRELAEELRREREELEERLGAVERRADSEEGRAEGYRRQLVEQGRQLALVEGELMRASGSPSA